MPISLPIYVIGAGGIVNTAHLPAYREAGFRVSGIFDLDHEKARVTAAAFNIPKVFESLALMLEELPENVVFDVAVPGHALPGILEQLPEGATVLMQKPMGEDLPAAKRILDITRQRKMLAAVNFQLRYAPFIMEAKRMIAEGIIGEINDIEINVNVFTPWHLWDFLKTAPRLEILYHSIHYIDLVRHLLGNPEAVFAKTVKHPAMPGLEAVRSNIIMDYGDRVRANILTSHCHQYGLSKQQSYIRLEGSRGAILINFGTLINYPFGTPDSFEYVVLEAGKESHWQKKQVEGSWFPQAFAGSMRQLINAATGITKTPDNSVEDCIDTMACVEAAYISSETRGVNLESLK